MTNHNRQPYRDSRPVSRAVRCAQQEVAPDRWVVNIDDETDALAEAHDVEPGRPVPVNPTDHDQDTDDQDTAAGHETDAALAVAAGNDDDPDDSDDDDGEGDEPPASGGLVLAGDSDRDPKGPGTVPGSGSGSAVVVPWSGRPVEQREVIPAWLRTKDERRAVTAYAKARVAHVSKYHGARVPLYAARLAGRAPAGAGRIIVLTARWVSDAESKDVRLTAAKTAKDGRDATDYLRVANQHRDLVKHRTIMLLFALALAAVGIGGIAVAAGTGTKVLLAAAVIAGLGVLGRNADKPMIDHAVVVPRARKLTADVVVRAFVGAKLCKDDDGQRITFPQPIARDGHGWRAVIDLPYGVTADKAIKQRTAIASGLDLDEVQVWLDRVRGTSGSARRLSLWVADEDPYAKPSGTWPWAADTTTGGVTGSGKASAGSNSGGGRRVAKSEASVFEPFPFGQDQRGRPVELVLMFTWLLVAAIPRMGKTFAARLAVLAAALDPHVRLYIYDGKGGKDWKEFKRIAHRFGLGAMEDVVRALRDDLVELVDEMNRRYAVLGSLPDDRCPEGKVTPALARDKRLGLHPILIVIDECQRYFGHKEYGDQIVDLLIELAKVGPAAGIMAVLATQKPDPDSIPTKLRDVIGTRFCLNVANWQSSDAALGAGAYSAGYDASRFQRSHKGVGWLLGADDSGAVEEAVTVRTYLAANADATKIIDRAYAARVNAGTLSGQAIGELPERPEQISVLADIAAVFAPDEDRLWSQVILHRLADHRPGFYDGWDATQLAAAVKPYGLSTVQVWGTTGNGQAANKRGLTREAVALALDRQDRRDRQAVTTTKDRDGDRP